MDLELIVKTLVGDIQPEGASHIDKKRFVNLKKMCDLVSKLVGEIDKVSYENKDRHEHSMKEMGEYANNFLTNDLGISE